LITVVAAIIKKDTKILITRRAKDQKLAGFWEFPGGKIEAGESEELCLIREIKEELNLVIAIEERLGEIVHSYEFANILLIAYACQYRGGDICLTVHDDFCWVEVSELSGFCFAPADEPFVRQLIGEGQFSG